MDIIGFTEDGWTVFDRHNSHLHPGVQNILPAALGKINMNKSKKLEFLWTK